MQPFALVYFHINLDSNMHSIFIWRAHMHHILQPWLSCMPTVILNLIRSHSRFWIVCLFFRHRQFLYRYKNSWKRCNQPQSSRCNSIFFDFIFVTVIVIVDAILVFDGIFENCAAAQQFIHCTVFDLAICCVCSQFCSIFFQFDFFFALFRSCIVCCHIAHTQAHTRSQIVFRIRVTNSCNCI